VAVFPLSSAPLAREQSRVAAKLRKAQPANRHVRLYRWELESAAYRSLSLYARCLLIE
jgi:hypothetical protein